MKKSNKEEKLKFIKNEILTSTIIGGLGRGHRVYKEAAQKEDREKLQKLLREKLKEYGENYKSEVSDERHIKNIEGLQGIANKYSKILDGRHLKLGRAQKLLNLYLKYLWVLNLISEPPHCPFDFTVIKDKKLGLGLNINWTELDKPEDYQKMVDKAREIARNKGLSIAEWELQMWNEYFKKSS